MLDLFSGSLFELVSVIVLCALLPFVGSFLIDGAIVGVSRGRWLPMAVAVLMVLGTVAVGIAAHIFGSSRAQSSTLGVPSADYGPTATLLVTICGSLAAIALLIRVTRYLRGAR